MSKIVKDILATSDLSDVWESNHGFTWRRPGTDSFSTIDRIVYTNKSFKLVEVKSNWSMSFSDHAAVEASFDELLVKKGVRTRITRLDPYLAKTDWARQKIESDFNEMYLTACPDWGPHMKLEFAKLCIRTVVENVQAERNRREASEEEAINEELETAIEAISNHVGDNRRLGDLLEHTESLRARKSELINEKGERLAHKLGTKWYNEGEKSTRYFLRLLNRSLPDDFQSLIGVAGDITDPEAIEAEIVNFYKTLYENYENGEIQVMTNDDDFFKELEPIAMEKEDNVVKPVELHELDIAELDKALKTRAIGRTLVANHPFIKLLAERSNFESFFYPNCPLTIDPVHKKGISLLADHRSAIWDNVLVERNRLLIEAVKATKITEILSREGKLSLNFFTLRVRGKKLIGDLNQYDFGQIRRFVNPNKTSLILRAIENPALPPSGIKLGEFFLTTRGVFKTISSCTSKEIRESRHNKQPICSYKIGTTLTVSDAASWGNKLNQLTSTRHKNTLLRFAHGEFYTKDKLFRYNLINTNECPRCGQLEDLKHKFLECEYSSRIWRHATSLCRAISAANYNTLESNTVAMGSNPESNPTILTLNAEILLRISYLRDDQNYLIHPKAFVTNCIKALIRNERKTDIKEGLNSLLA